MTAVHQFLGWACIAGSIAVVGTAAWSVIAMRRSGGAMDHRFAVDRAVLATVLLLAAAGLVGLALLLTGSRPADPLHLAYGPAAMIALPVGIWIGSRAVTGGGTRLRRDVWTAAAGIVLLGLGLRLFATG